MKSAILIVALCVIIGAVCINSNPLQSGQQKQQQSSEPEPLQFGHDGTMFLMGNDCGPNEVLTPGALPICEPTCSNPKPMCPRIFHSSLDFVPCFCKKPLVRNEQTRQCVELSQCPKTAKQ